MNSITGTRHGVLGIVEVETLALYPSTASRHTLLPLQEAIDGWPARRPKKAVFTSPTLPR